MPLDVELSEVIRLALDSRAQDIWTSFPARVKVYHAGSETQPPTADLEPVIRRPLVRQDGSVINEALPVLPSVPIVFPRGGGDSYAITWQLAAGDHVLVHVTTNAIGNWQRTGETSDPGDVRTHALGSCFAVPGAAPNTKPLLQAQDQALVLEGPEIKIGRQATDYAALASKVDANFNALLEKFSTWTPVAQDGGAALKTLLSELSFDAVGASKTKVE